MKQILTISESEIRSAVKDYLAKKGILVKEGGVLHSQISFAIIGKRKIHLFNGYYINDGEYMDENYKVRNK